MLSQLNKIKNEIIEIRRHLHMAPELSFKEEKTALYITKYLHSLKNVQVHTNVGGNGIVANINGNRKGKIVALRADFDALPLLDEKDVPYKSKTPGVMHACGHDGHTAALLGVCKVLSQNTHSFDGCVRFIFQHAEEVAPGGAISMVKAGCLNGVDAIFATHLNAGVPVGQYTYAYGATMAIADKFTITIKGKGGHGAAPHETIDPIVASANVVQNLQQIVSRRLSPLSQAVITVGQINAGTAFNIIADTCTIVGTVRTLSESVQNTIISEIDKILKGMCKSSNTTYVYDYEKGYPATVNTRNETNLVVKSLTSIVSSKLVKEVRPSMGGEDFAYFLQKVPGCYFNTGAGNVLKGIIYPHHHPKFDIDEESLLYSSKGLLSIALNYLSK